jgi:hypothetical protein
MNYHLGIGRLKGRIGRDLQPELATLEHRLLDNLDSERLLGGTESTRRERNAIVASLNELTYRVLYVSFNDLCEPTDHTFNHETIAQPPAREPSDNGKAPTVFISYSWDSDEHKHWVRELATSLRADGIATLLDQWHLELGARLTQFMEQAVVKSEAILVVCTPPYKQRFDGRLGGAGYEGHIISTRLIDSLGVQKFIPVLRSGDWSSAVPIALRGIQGADLRGEPLSVVEYRRLVRALYGLKPQAPGVGVCPTWL